MVFHLTLDIAELQRVQEWIAIMVFFHTVIYFTYFIIFNNISS